MNIFIILCPSLIKRCPLIGLGYLSAYLGERGHHVTVVDLNTEMDVPDDYDEGKWNNEIFVKTFIFENRSFFESLSERILQSGDPEIIGFSVWATTKYASLALAKMIKQKDKDRLVVFGGPECSFTGGDLIREEEVDAVVYGEGEETFAEVAYMYEKQRKIDFCPGTLLKKNGDVIDCGYRKEIANLDRLPFPDYSQFLLAKYYSPNSLSMTFYRGCLRHCTFCNTSVTWRRFRSRSAENIYEEMLFQIERHPDLQKFEVDDTALNLDLPMLSKLCDLILADGLKINWGGSALVRREMDSGLIKKMAKAGCNCLGYGLESGSQKIVDSMGKGFKIEDAERVLCDTYNAGIETVLGIIVGFPGETDECFQKTLDFIKRNKDFISKINFPSECCIGCNSHMHRHPEKFDVILEPKDDGEHWMSKDYRNTHKIRQKRIDIFNKFINSLGISYGNYATVYKNENIA